MDYKDLLEKNFLEYASYVIKDRAIPNLEDGLKPVQRRILHSLFEMHDGSFHKVANVVGHCMKYHPHGDASIYAALVNLANKDLLIDKQGNFGNSLTGDGASAARYIECRLQPLTHRLLYNPEITIYENSYDGRNREPVFFRSKIPLMLIQGAEGIAVGMSTKILPHNCGEVIQAMKAALKGEAFQIYPDFPSGGFIDISRYEEGNGKVICRASVDVSDSKKILIHELPYGVTTESFINSVDSAVKKGKLKVLSIQDFSTDRVEIEIRLPRGSSSQEILPALYAFTEAQISLSLNLLVISQGLPRQMTTSELIIEYSILLENILKDELLCEKSHKERDLHLKTLEEVFIEKRIYKVLEDADKQQDLAILLKEALLPYLSLLQSEPSLEDLKLLLNIPIRRISQFDRSRSQKDIVSLQSRLKKISHHLKYLKEYASEFLESLQKDYPELGKRKTQLTQIEVVSQKEIAQRNKDLFYNKKEGYLGTEIQGDLVEKVSDYDKLLIIQEDGSYSVIKVTNKLFVGTLLFVGIAERSFLERSIFNMVYKKESDYYLKRFKLEKFISGKVYQDLLPKGAKVISLSVNAAIVEVQFRDALKGISKQKINILNNFLVKGKSASGKRISQKSLKVVRWISGID